MSNEDDSPCMAHLGDSVSGFTAKLFYLPCHGRHRTAPFLPTDSLSHHRRSTLLGHSGSRDNILCSFPSCWLLLAFSYRAGTGGGLWRPGRKGRDSLALLQLLAEVLPSPSLAVPPLSCQLLPRPARGWEVEKERVASCGKGGCSPSC